MAFQSPGLLSMWPLGIQWFCLDFLNRNSISRRSKKMLLDLLNLFSKVLEYKFYQHSTAKTSHKNNPDTQRGI